MGGAKVEDKLPAIKVLAKDADAVLVGGKLVQEINDEKIDVPDNVLVGKLNPDGYDIAPETTASWKPLIAALARRRSLALPPGGGPSTKFCSAVTECTVVIKAFAIPNFS